jgi:hypothetical protein
MKYTYHRKQEVKYRLAKIDIRHVSRACFNTLKNYLGVEALVGGKIDHNKLRKFLTEIPAWRQEFAELEAE